MKSNGLFCEQMGSETFFHPNKTDRAEIDYILLNDKSKSIVRNVAVDNDQTLNTSDHVPVIGTFKIHTKKTVNQTTKVMCKPKWDRCDRSVYRDVVRDNLLPFDAFLPTGSEEFDILRPLSHLTAVLKQATLSSIPKFKPEVTVRQLQSRPWSERIHSAIKESRLAWWDWRKSGSPTDPMHDTVIRKVTARKTLRNEQRQGAATRRRDAVKEIMRAKNDQKTFYKLIQNQRKSSNPQLQTLIVNNKECETQERIRKGWADNFHRLAPPLENTKFDKEYKQMVDLDVEAIEILCREESSPMDPVMETEVASALKRMNNNKAADIMGLTSEHLKLAGIETIEFLTPLLNYIIRSRSISAVLKEGILTPHLQERRPQ